MNSSTVSSERHGKGLCTLGATAALALLGYSILTMVLLAWLGGPPHTAQECFDLLRQRPLTTLLRLDLLTIVAMPLFYLFYAGLFLALKRNSLPLAALSTALAFAGVTLILASPSVLTLFHLSKEYAAAASEPRRVLLLAAGEGAMYSDMWHGTGAMMGGILLQLAGMLISIAMLQSGVFSKLVGYLGIFMHALDLVHILVGLFAPSAGVVLMVIAGPLYLIWFPMVSRRLYQMGRSESPDL